MAGDQIINPPDEQACFNLCFDQECNFLMWAKPDPSYSSPISNKDLICLAGKFPVKISEDALKSFTPGSDEAHYDDAWQWSAVFESNWGYYDPMN